MGAATDEMDFMAELQADFLREVSFQLEQCEGSYLKLENPEVRVEELGKIFMLAHSLKGTGAAVGLDDLARFAHQVEDLLTLLRNSSDIITTEIISLLLRCGDAFNLRIEQLKRKDGGTWHVAGLEVEVRAMTAHLQGLWQDLARTTEVEVKTREQEQVTAGAVVPAQAVPAQAAAAAPVQPTSIQQEVVKIDASRVESVLDLVGELVVLKSQLINRAEAEPNDQRFVQLVGMIDKTVRELHNKTLGMRLTPLRSLFLQTQRVIRDLSVKLEQSIEFVMEGEDTEIDRTRVEALSDPLLHLARNFLNQGIERSEKRKMAGKPEKGLIRLKASQRGGRILIELVDDGGGLDRERICRKAIEKGLLAEGDLVSITSHQVDQLIFAPEFSTLEKVTDVRDRGAGMDVVRAQVEKLKGRIELLSEPGRGTTIRISLPLPTSILDGMVVGVGEYPYIIPMESIRELVELDTASIVPMFQGVGSVWNHREREHPIVDLRKKFGSPGDSASAMVALVDMGGKEVALFVDSLHGQSQVVLKPLEPSVRACKGLSGAAILGDGRVARVIDPYYLGSAGVDAA